MSDATWDVSKAAGVGSKAAPPYVPQSPALAESGRTRHRAGLCDTVNAVFGGC